MAAQARGSVVARRVEAEDIQVRRARRCASANAGIVSPLEMLRPGPVTTSVAHCDPEVSSTKAPPGSTTRKLLS